MVTVTDKELRNKQTDKGYRHGKIDTGFRLRKIDMKLEYRLIVNFDKVMLKYNIIESRSFRFHLFSVS